MSAWISGEFFSIGDVFWGLSTGVVNALSIVGDIYANIRPSTGLVVAIAGNTFANLISARGATIIEDNDPDGI